MAQDAPPLVLSDIVHGMSPSPAPQAMDTASNEVTRRSVSPEVLAEEQVAAMRQRVLELGPIPEVRQDAHLRERELVDMVLKLTSPTHPSPSQLLRQAETISGLTEQRNFLVREAEEQRARWESEKVGWERMAEALIAQRHRTGKGTEGPSGYVTKDDASHVVPDHERHYTGVETDNKALRTKLADTQHRLSALESQLTQLRPLLLMQPTISQATYERSYGQNSKASSSKTKPTSSLQPTGDEPPIEVTPSEEEALMDQQLGSKSHLPQTTPLPNKRAVLAYPSTKKVSAKTSKGKEKEKERDKDVGRTSLMADARAEHLLLAAQRLGRERVFVLGGLMQVQKEKAREREVRRKVAAEEKEKDKERTPKTPKRHGVKMGHKDSLAQPGPTVTPGGIAGGPGRGLFPVPTQGSFHLLNTPISSSYSTFPLSPTRPQKGKVAAMATPTTSPPITTARTNPPTPLDSLLSAARSMMEPVSPSSSHENDNDNDKGHADSDYSEGTPGPVKRKTRKRALPESPVPPKRRKVGAGAQSQNRVLRDRAGGGERVRSALDVLADQAAAAATPPGKGKGKGRERDKGEGSSTPTSRPSQRPKTPMPENGTWSMLKPVQWGEADSSSSPIGEEKQGENGKGKDGEGTVILRQDQIELARMVFNTHAGAEEHTHTQEAELPPSSPLAPHSTKSLSQLPRSPTPDVFGSIAPTTDPVLALTSFHSDDAPPDLSNFESQPHEGPAATTSNAHQRSASIPNSFLPENEHDEFGIVHTRRDTAPELSVVGLTSMPDFDLGDGIGFGEDAEMEQAMHRDLARVGGQDIGSSLDTPSKRARSPYVKWSKEEDDLLAQAVAKHGQKWDLVQKALPSRGYHQVRQRWLRKLGVFDNKPDLSSYQTGGVIFPPTANIITNGQSLGSPGPNDSPLPQPKLGLAPLSSELAFSKRG